MAFGFMFWEQRGVAGRKGPLPPNQGFRHSPMGTVASIPAEKTHQEMASEVRTVALGSGKHRVGALREQIGQTIFNRRIEKIKML